MTVHVLSEYESRELRLEPDVVEILASRHSQHLALAPMPGSGRWLVGRPSTTWGRSALVGTRS